MLLTQLLAMSPGNWSSQQHPPEPAIAHRTCGCCCAGSLTGYTPRRSSYEPRTAFYRSVSLPVRSTVPAPGSSTPSDEHAVAAQMQRLKKPHGFSLSPIFARRRPVADSSQQADGSPEDVTPDASPDKFAADSKDGVAHSAPITIERQPRSASRDLAVAYDDLAMTPSDTSRTTASSLASGALPNSSSDHDGALRFLYAQLTVCASESQFVPPSKHSAVI